jgi:hypothetical protein
MSEPAEKKDTGLTVTIIRPTPPPAPIRTKASSRSFKSTMETIPDVSSIQSTPVPTPTAPSFTHTVGPDAAGSPFSPFYDHAEAPVTLSLSNAPTIAVPNESKTNLSPYDTDLEANLPYASKEGFTNTSSNPYKPSCHKLKSSTSNISGKPCPVWPGQKALLAQKKADSRGKCGCNPMRGLDARTRFWCKVAIAACIVGAAVGLGFGISRATGSGIYKDESSNAM